jgi:tetratricopeptide (TPR) repeat protein
MTMQGFLSRRGTLLVSLALLGGACHRGESRPAPERRSRALALMKLGGAAPVDKIIAAEQEKLARSPDRVDEWIALGQAWVRKARESADPVYYVNADACAEEGLLLVPEHRKALELRGLVLLNDHKFGQARDLARALLAREPADPLALGMLSDSALELGMYDEAEQAAQRMMDLKPNLASYSRASHLLWLRNDIKKARESVRLAMDSGRDPSDPEPLAWVVIQAAMLFWHEGDYAGAGAGLDQAERLFPNYPPTLVARGQVALGLGDAPRAVALLEQAWHLSPTVRTAWLLGDARRARGDEAGAKEAYDLVERNGRTLDPRTLALFWAVKDREHDAALALAESERTARDDIYSEDVVAWALYRAGRTPEARAASEKATRLGTPDARLIYHAGAIRIAAGDVAAGAAQVQRALKLNPRFDATESVEAAALLERYKKPGTPR